VDEINPFFTFFNQSQTNNKFHKPPILTLKGLDLQDKYQKYLDKLQEDKNNCDLRKSYQNTQKIGLGRGFVFVNEVT